MTTTIMSTTPDPGTMSHEEFHHRMRTDLDFRLAMIQQRAIELGEEPPTELLDTTIYDDAAREREVQEKYQRAYYERMQHEAQCRRFGYDPGTTSPDDLARAHEIIALDTRLTRETGAPRIVFHPCEIEAMEREDEEIEESDEELRELGD